MKKVKGLNEMNIAYHQVNEAHCQDLSLDQSVKKRERYQNVFPLPILLFCKILLGKSNACLFEHDMRCQLPKIELCKKI